MAVSDHLSEQQITFIERYIVPIRPMNSPRTDEIPPDIVRKRAFLVTRWKRLPGEIMTEVDVLIGAVARDLPYERPDELRGAINARMTKLIEEMMSAINEAIDRSVSQGDGSYAAVGAKIDELALKIRSDGVVKALGNNGLVNGGAFEQVFTTALDEVRAALTV
jgi:hypothetical protein